MGWWEIRGSRQKFMRGFAFLEVGGVCIGGGRRVVVVEVNRGTKGICLLCVVDDSLGYSG